MPHKQEIYVVAKTRNAYESYVHKFAALLGGKIFIYVDDPRILKGQTLYEGA